MISHEVDLPVRFQMIAIRTEFSRPTVFLRFPAGLLSMKPDREKPTPEKLRNSRASEHPARRGFSLIEMIGACVLLGILLSMAAPMFAIVARERLATEQRQFALQHAVNLLERARQQAWSNLQPGVLPVPDADQELRTVLPGVERTLEVQPTEGEPDSRQLIATIRWKDRGDQFMAPIRLSSWVYDSKGAP